jgi:hypothetical protein
VSDLTTHAISIRQPWAWLILYAGKDIENRTWKTAFRGPVLIHAAKGMTRAGYHAALIFAMDLGVNVPDWKELQRGGIVGQVDLVNCVTSSRSPWFEGPYGFVLRNPKPLPFQPNRGALGIFKVGGAAC